VASSPQTYFYWFCHLAVSVLSVAQAWLLGTAESAPAVDAGHHEHTSGAVTTSSSQVVWTTNIPADSSVDYGTTTAYGNSTPV